MSIVRELAELTVQNIKKSQHFFTRPSRKKALKEFEKILRDPNASEDEVIFHAMQQKQWVSDYGTFGWRGRAGSNFLLQMDLLINQFFYLRQNEDDQFTSPTKKLAQSIVENIKKSQNSKTDKSRIIALTNFQEAINQPAISDQEIIAAAQKQKDYVNEKGRFGFWGRGGSTFLYKITTFIQQAIHITRLSEQEKQNAKSSTLFTQTLLDEMQKKYFQSCFNKKARYVPAIYDLKDTKRDILEGGIKRLLEKHFGKNEKISRAWRYRMDKVITGEDEPSNSLFFQNFANQLFPLEKLPGDLREKLLAYQEICADIAYLDERSNRISSIQSETHEEIFHLIREKEKREMEEIDDRPKVKSTITSLFSEQNYSFYKSTEEYKVDEALREHENANRM